MAIFRRLFSSSGKAKKKDYPNIIQGLDPLESWQKVGELGDGAFGKVFKTEHRESGKLAAMKRVPIQDDTELDDFMVEIDILAECKHRNIVGLHEAYFYDQALWIYIEFCPGGAVDDIIIELDHGLSEPQIRSISKQMFEALEYLHGCQCIHRDLKAGNILLCPDGSIRLADFGVSAKDSKGKYKHDTFIGTPYWMAPEVVVCETVKDEPYDCKADIWSAGITFIELADMNPPYHEMSPMRVLQKIVKKEPPILAVPSKWSKDFNDIIAKCLVKQPSGRLSASQLLEHPFLAGVVDNRPLRILYQEIKSDVEEIVEELPEDADLSVDPGHTEDILPAPVDPGHTEDILPAPVDPECSADVLSTSVDPERNADVLSTSVDPERSADVLSTSVDPGYSADDLSTSVNPGDLLPDPSELSASAMDEPPISPVGHSAAVPPVSDSRPEAMVSPISIPEVVLSPSSDVGPEAVVSLTSDTGPEAILTPSSSKVSEAVSPSPTDELAPSSLPMSPVDSRTGEESSMSSEISSTPGLEDRGHKYATLSRVRKFKVDGQVMQSTTTKIVDITANRTLRDNKKQQQMRKQDFRELKQLQREEMKEATEFYAKVKLDRDTQERKFELEVVDIEKRYESERELLTKQQKKETDRQEHQHIQQFKAKLKQIKSQQSKDLKHFKESMKEEEKTEIKRVESSASKLQKKALVNQVKTELQTRRGEKEASFLTKQAADLEAEVTRILNEQKEERKMLELRFLDARHDIRRSNTSLLWELEQRQKQEHHQLVKQQLREAFHMQRHQMHMRHQTEAELQERRDQLHLEELRQQQLLEKRQLPKKLKADHKQKISEARKAIRNKKADKETLKKLDDQYVQLCKLETDLMNERHDKDLETLRAELEANMRELQEIQNEKKMQLTQQETNKVKELDEQHVIELREWRAEISQRKQRLEEEFRASRKEKEEDYSKERPFPKQLRTSLSLPERASKALSTASLESSASPPPPQPPLNPLDEVVLGTPTLNHVSPDNDALQNGNSS